MKNLQKNVTTLFDPQLESQEGLFNFTERLVGGLPGRCGNALLLLKLGIPTPSAGLAFPRATREQMTVDLHLGVGPGKDFIRHVRPCGGDDVRSSSDGPVYRIHISGLPVPQKHQIHERVGI